MDYALTALFYRNKQGYTQQVKFIGRQYILGTLIAFC